MNADLPTPAGFAAATQFVRPEDVAEHDPVRPATSTPSSRRSSPTGRRGSPTSPSCRWATRGRTSSWPRQPPTCSRRSGRRRRRPRPRAGRRAGATLAWRYRRCRDSARADQRGPHLPASSSSSPAAAPTSRPSSTQPPTRHTACASWLSEPTGRASPACTAPLPRASRRSCAGCRTTRTATPGMRRSPTWSASHEPALVVSAGFMKLLGPKVLGAYTVLNTHPALLPSFPGAHAVRDALAYGARSPAAPSTSSTPGSTPARSSPRRR